ncbi:MAG TPA: tetratricopeptide repeat protein [Candidatus Bilamarchaeum sp.]|nr:tetratricopeptide repeat protein [Candidatus Bilamarchaeum sp.]
MDGIEEARNLLSGHRFGEAAEILDRLLHEDPDSDELWYLRGLVYLKAKNYDSAQECFERAVLLGKKSKYYQIKGMAHFELFELEQAIDAFGRALQIEPEDATTNFFMAICYLFQDDPRGEDFIKAARRTDQKKTAQLVLNFYTFFLKDDPRIGPEAREKIERAMKSLRG